MAKIIINGTEHDVESGITALQAALRAGLDVPHYCYHPALSVVASCRLCLMEMKLPNPKTGELGWAPKLFPSCQTPVKDGMEVRFDSPAVINNQKSVMEYFLLNHPLDCPVCDQAGECYLQDYSERFGSATSRMVDQKIVNPKKDIGPRTLLYSDRCVMCTRCVRFTQEISGTHELCVINRGARDEIDVFPGIPLDNKLQGNTVDICPVGALLDKDFLFKQRVWLLRGHDSVCPGCSTGCAIRVDANAEGVWRLKPRYNPGVNDYWICDDGRFGWKYVRDDRRLVAPALRRGAELVPADWEDLPQALEYRFTELVAAEGDDKVAALLSPMLACEEAWLIATTLRRWAPRAVLALGSVPIAGEDELFPIGCTRDDAKFIIRREKCPNRRGIELLLKRLGGPTMTSDEFSAACADGRLRGVWLTGGYPTDWVTDDFAKAVKNVPVVVLQDLFPSKLIDTADVLLPARAWTEREGSFVNHAGLIQPFTRAIDPPDGGWHDGQYLQAIAGLTGLYNAERIRARMAETMPEFAEIAEAPPLPAHQH